MARNQIDASAAITRKMATRIRSACLEALSFVAVATKKSDTAFGSAPPRGFPWRAWLDRVPTKWDRPAAKAATRAKRSAKVTGSSDLRGSGMKAGTRWSAAIITAFRGRNVATTFRSCDETREEIITARDRTPKPDEGSATILFLANFSIRKARRLLGDFQPSKFAIVKPASNAAPAETAK
jgi:hypothetical protein